MADIRIKDLPTTATQTASDDFIALDGTVNGTRKIDASAPSFKTSVTSPSVVAPAATNLTLTGGSTGASLVLGQGATGANIILTPSGTGEVSASSNIVLGVANNKLRSGVSNGYITPEDGTIGCVIYSAGGVDFRRNSGTQAMRLVGGTGNLLIGTTTDDANTRLQLSASTGGILVDSGAASNGTYPALQLKSSGAGWGSGIQFRNTTANKTYGIYAGSGGTLSLVDNTSLVEFATVTGGAIGVGNFKFNNTTAALNTASGALQVAGGVGVAGALFAGGNISTLRAGSALITNESTVNGAASEFIAKGLNSVGTARQANIGLNRFADDVLSISDGTTERLRLNLTNGNTNLTASTASTGAGTGALQVAGGIYAGAASVFGSTLKVGAGSFLNFATGYIYGVLKVGGDASQGAGTIVLGDDGSTVQNVGVWRGTSNGIPGTNTGNVLNLGGYSGVTITTGAAALGSQTVAASFSSTAAATLFGAVTVGRDNSGAADSSVTITAPSDNADLFFRALTTSTKRSRLRFFNSLGDEQARIQSGGEVENPRGNLVLSTSGASGLTTALTIDSTQAATFAGKVTVSSTTAGSAGAGALVVSGGLATGAASYFGGNLIVANDKFSNFDGSGAARMGMQSVSVAPYSVRMLGSADAVNTRDFSFGYYTGDNAANAWNQKAAINSYTGAATFSGAIAINNTTAAAVAAPSTHKVSILIGGVQYYLLASNV